MYDVSRFKDLHPGGTAVLLDADVGASFSPVTARRAHVSVSYLTAGQDTTEAFYGLHRHEVLLKPQYARLQIGTIEGKESVVAVLPPGAPSNIPYAEPTWLSNGFHSPYFKKVFSFLNLLFCSVC